MELIQFENGFTRVGNEILDKLAMVKLTPTQYRLIFCILRNTYGYGRSARAMSLSFLSGATGCDKRQIQRELKALTERNIIQQKINNGFTRVIYFNRNHREWIDRTYNDSSSIGETDDDEIDNDIINNDVINNEVIDNGGIDDGEIDNDDIPEEPVTDSPGVPMTVSPTNKDILNKDIKKEYCASFESLWNLYPNRKGKGEISASQIRKLEKIGYDKIKLCIERYVRDKPDWQEWKNGSTFFNSGYIDYLDGNYQPHTCSEENRFMHVKT